MVPARSLSSIGGISSAAIAARGVARIDGAWDKMIVRASGIEMPLRLLPPYQGVDSESYEECFENLKARYPEWIALRC